MINGVELARSEVGVDTLRQYIAGQVDLGEDAEAKIAEGNSKPFGLTSLLVDLSTLVEPLETNIERIGAEEDKKPLEERDCTLAAGSPYFYGSVLGLELVRVYTPELQQAMCSVPISKALSDGRPIFKRLPDIQRDITVKSLQGYVLAAPFYDLLTEVDLMFRDGTTMEPLFLKRGFGMVLYLMDQAHKSHMAHQQRSTQES